MNVYTVEFHGMPNHVGLYINNNLYHAVGDPIRGFRFEIKRDYNLASSLTYIHDSLNYLFSVNLNIKDIEKILRNIPVQEPIPPRLVFRMKRGIDYGDCRTWVKLAVNKLYENT